MAGTEDRPLVTFALFAYNQERYIAEAVAGAFAQDYSPLEIILSDDCSTDSTFEIMSRMAAEYKGPHKIVLNRNERNLYIGGHVNRMFSIARGSLVVMAAGDDISAPTRTSSLVSVWAEDGFRADCVFSDCHLIDDQGRQKGSLYLGKEAGKTRSEAARDGVIVLGAVASWTKRMWRKWGELENDVTAEDAILTVRAAVLGGLLHVNAPLVKYRTSESSWILTPSNIKQVRQKGVKISEMVLRSAENSHKIYKELGDDHITRMSLINVERARFYSLVHKGNLSFIRLFVASLINKNINTRLFMRHAVYRYFPSLYLAKKYLFK